MKDTENKQKRERLPSEDKDEYGRSRQKVSSQVQQPINTAIWLAVDGMRQYTTEEYTPDPPIQKHIITNVYPKILHHDDAVIKVVPPSDPPTITVLERWASDTYDKKMWWFTWNNNQRIVGLHTDPDITHEGRIRFDDEQDVMDWPRNLVRIVAEVAMNTLGLCALRVYCRENMRSSFALLGFLEADTFIDTRVVYGECQHTEISRHTGSLIRMTRIINNQSFPIFEQDMITHLQKWLKKAKHDDRNLYIYAFRPMHLSPTQTTAYNNVVDSLVINCTSVNRDGNGVSVAYAHYSLLQKDAISDLFFANHKKKKIRDHGFSWVRKTI